jgi:transcription initiation factor TFIID subunit 9B
MESQVATVPAAANGATTASDETHPSARPRDARLVHTLLASQGVASYQERVPLMLIDFAYRYTRSVLADALALSAEGYGAPPPHPSGGRGAAALSQEDITLTSLRLAVASRQIAQIQPKLPKADLLEMGAEVNRVAMPKLERDFGLRLPSEKYMLTGAAYGLKEAWQEMEDMLSEDEDAEPQTEQTKDEVMKDAAELGAPDLEDEDMEGFEEAMGTEDKTMEDA